MTCTRREFLRNLGVTVAALALSRCVPSGTDDHPSRTRLRNGWLNLARLDQEAQADAEEIDRIRSELVLDHRAALDDLVAAGELDAGVADQIQVAFSEAAFHVWRTKAPITCYIVYPAEAVVREDVLKQLEVLSEISDGLDPRVAKQVQAAIARDIAFFEALAAGGKGRDLLEQFEAHEIEVGREAIEASHFLVDLMVAPGEP